MQRDVIWSPWTDIGLEHLRLVQNGGEILGDGIILRVKEENPFRSHYRIRCDESWRVREVNVSLEGRNEVIHLKADGKGHWTDGAGNWLSQLDGCYEVDLSATPFTNTFPIRRLGLKPNESAGLVVVYIAIPEMEVRPVQQRYTCLQTSNKGGLYKYEGLFRGFTANLPVDRDGLVFDYPETFKRVWPLT